MTTTLTSHVREYVDRVREALADLPADDVDDLVCGLTADLTETLLDSPVAPPAGRDEAMDLDAIFGSPAEYAAELREAAGLGAAESAPVPRAVAALRRRWRTTRDRVRSHPTWVSCRDFLASIRPAWWVVRGLAVGVAGLASAFGTNRQVWERPAGWVVLAVAVVASVQWGRRRARAVRRREQGIERQAARRGWWAGGLVNAVGVVAALAAVTVLGSAQMHDRIEFAAHVRATERSAQARSAERAADQRGARSEGGTRVDDVHLAAPSAGSSPPPVTYLVTQSPDGTSVTIHSVGP